MLTSDSVQLVKVPILGNVNVGKTTLYNYFRAQTSKQFTYKKNDFILIENCQYKNRIFNIQFWDSIGFHTYKQIPKEMLEGASIGIVMYDIADTSKNLYSDIVNWTKRLLKENNKINIPILLLGNKLDLRKRKTMEFSDHSTFALRLSQELHLTVKQIEISALSRENCDQILGIVLDFV